MTEPPPSADHLEIHRIAFEQGNKGLSNQNDTLTSIRQSASAVVALSAAAAAFLGREAFVRLNAEGYESQPWHKPGIWAALLSLVLSVVCVIQLLRPRDGWIFHSSPSRIIDQFAQGEHATSLSRTYEVLARFAEENYESNLKILNKLFRWLWTAFVSVMIQVVAWLAVMT